MKVIVIMRMLKTVANPQPVVHSITSIPLDNIDSIDSYAKDMCQRQKKMLSDTYPEFADAAFTYSVHDMDEGV